MPPTPDQLDDFARRYAEAWLIASSQGRCDQAEYERQVEHGFDDAEAVRA